MRSLAARARRVSHQAVIRIDADQHGIAFQNGPLSAEERELDRFAERVREQKGADGSYFHVRVRGNVG
jgi:hypothetical protein